MKRVLLASAFVFAQAAWPAAAQDAVSAISLRLGGKEVPLSAELRARLTGLARETLSRCGPNTRHHPHNFGLAAMLASERWQRVLEGSRCTSSSTRRSGPCRTSAARWPSPR